MAAAAEVMQSMSRPKNGAERRLLNNVLRRAVSLEILRQYNPRMRMLDEELLGTDRVLQRWAISVGSGMPVEDWDVAQVIINSAKVEVDYIEATGAKGTGFVPQDSKPRLVAK